jgi:hypothetical protein
VEIIPNPDMLVMVMEVVGDAVEVVEEEAVVVNGGIVIFGTIGYRGELQLSQRCPKTMRSPGWNHRLISCRKHCNRYKNSLMS